MKRLTLSESNQLIGGVCGGIGEYLGVDPTVIRIIWIIATLFGGVGVIAYILCWILIPKKDF